jgi:hypothetical protein
MTAQDFQVHFDHEFFDLSAQALWACAFYLLKRNTRILLASWLIITRWLADITCFLPSRASRLGGSFAGWLISPAFRQTAPHCLVDNPPRWVKTHPSE